jgi:hypothetical protein
LTAPSGNEKDGVREAISINSEVEDAKGLIPNRGFILIETRGQGI